MIVSPEAGHVVQVVPAAGVHRGSRPEVAVCHSVGHISLPSVSAELHREKGTKLEFKKKNTKTLLMVNLTHL